MHSVKRPWLSLPPPTTVVFLGLSGLALGLLARLADSRQWSREISSYLGIWWLVIVATSIVVAARHADRSDSTFSPRIRAAAITPSLVLACALLAYYLNSSVAVVTIVFWVLVAVVAAPAISYLSALFWIRPNQVWSPFVAGALGGMPLAEALSITTTSRSSSRWGAVWVDVAVGALLCVVLLAHTRAKMRCVATISMVTVAGPFAFALFAEVYRRFGSL